MLKLKEQIEKIYKNCNRGSVSTRKRYKISTLKFCEFIEKRFGLENFKNVNGKHIRAFVDYERANNVPDITIENELIGIYFFYKFSGGTNTLPDKKEFKFKKELKTIEDILWTKEEVENAIRLSEIQGNSFIEKALKMSSYNNKGIEDIAVALTDSMRCDTDKVKERIRNWVHNNRNKFSERKLKFGGSRGVFFYDKE